MITIQGFARLCGCNTQTLRYYDRIGLLAPAKVDQWTGYRYYEEEQAMMIVKIKNLQQADFSIEEIKGLLGKEDSFLMEALEQKITEQEQKLEQIRKIQRSYLEETMNMQNIVDTITGYVGERLDNPAMWEEFGLGRDDETEITAKVHELLADWLLECRKSGDEVSLTADDKTISGLKDIAKKVKKGQLDDAEELMLTRGKQEIEREIPAGAEKVFERSGWDHISDFIGELPDLGNGKQKYFLFCVRKGSPVVDFGFPTMVLAVMAAKFNAMDGGMTCKTALSDDGQNHFELYVK